MAKEKENSNLIDTNVTNTNVEKNDNLIDTNVTNTNVEGNNNISPVPVTKEQVDDNKEAIKTAEKLKEKLVSTKIPKDPQNPNDIVVTVMINGYMWRINRGENVEVPKRVADILGEAGYI